MAPGSILIVAEIFQDFDIAEFNRWHCFACTVDCAKSLIVVHPALAGGKLELPKNISRNAYVRPSLWLHLHFKAGYFFNAGEQNGWVHCQPR